MNRQELEAMLRDLECDRTERTISTADTDKFSEAICAFANDMPNSRKPGYLFIGANGNGTASGALITDQMLQNLAAIRSAGHIQPLPAMVVEKWTIGGGEMAVIEVQPSDAPPVSYKGRIWIRVGPSRAIANQAEERILSERRIDRARTWDARACPEASLDDLALDLFKLTYRTHAVAWDILQENDRPLDLQLASLRFFDLRSQCPTNAGVVLFGLDPMYFFPGAYIQYVQYLGGTVTDEIIQERRLVGDMLSVLRDLKRLANEVAEARPLQDSGQADRMVFDYPPQAVHELLMNALIHRNYDGSTTPIMVNHFSDRIEVQNQGGLFGELTPDQFPHCTAYRNPILAEAAKVFGFVNRFGRGISIVQQQLSQNKSPDVEFTLEPNHFLAIIRRRP